jgi:hypothetical protein
MGATQNMPYCKSVFFAEKRQKMESLKFKNYLKKNRIAEKWMV